jgi:tape measure domain-containing protein
MANNGVEYVLSLKDLFTSKIRGATKETEKLNGSVGKTQKSISQMGGSLKSAFAAIGGAYIVNEVVKTTAAFEGLNNQLAFASGSAEKGAEDMEWLRSRAQYLGLDLQSAAEGFSKFSAAARNTSLEGQGVRDVFEGVAEATTAMHLSADDANGVFRALQQMLSKGKVSAEELNGQLGERLPGAFQIAARSMKMTTAQLMKMMQKGELMSEEFLPKFGAQLKKEFGDASEQAKDSLTANLNRMQNAFTDLKLAVGKIFFPIVNLIIKGIDFIKQKWDEIVFALQPFIDEIIFMKNEIMGIGKSFDWLSIFKSVLGAVRVILIAIQPFLHIAIKGFRLLAEIVIGVVAGIYDMIYSVGKFFGMKEFKKVIAPTKKAIDNNSGGGLYDSNSFTKDTMTSTDKGGTSTSAVESKGVQNFNISINKLVEKLEVSTTTIKEGGAAIKDEVAKALLEAVNDFQLLATK